MPCDLRETGGRAQVLPALGAALCRRGMVEALLRRDTCPLLLSCVIMGCCKQKAADWINQACGTVGAERGVSEGSRVSEAACPELGMQQDASRCSEAESPVRSRCRATVAPALLPLCRWLWEMELFSAGQGICECIFDILVTAAGGGSQIDLQACSRLSDGAIVFPWQVSVADAHGKVRAAAGSLLASASAATATAAVSGNDGVAPSQLQTLHASPEPVGRSAGLVKVLHALLQLAVQETMRWGVDGPFSACGKDSVTAPKSPASALVRMTSNGAADFLGSLSFALSAVSAAAETHGRPVVLPEGTPIVTITMHFVQGLDFQGRFGSQGELRRSTLAVCGLLRNLVLLLRRWADAAAGRRKPVPMLDGGFTVHKAMQSTEVLSRLAAAMLPDAAGRCGASSHVACMERTVAAASMAVSEISAVHTCGSERNCNGFQRSRDPSPGKLSEELISKKASAISCSRSLSPWIFLNAQ